MADPAGGAGTEQAVRFGRDNPHEDIRIGVLGGLMRDAVKAIMGDDGDNLAGIYDVGIKSACKYVRCEATPRVKGLIETKDSARIIKRNTKLMKLPWPGIRKIKLKDDRVTCEKWKRFALSHGVDSLSNSWRR